GNRLYENEKRKKVIDEIIKVKQEESNINLIISNFEKAYAEFNEKLKNDSRKDILNKILIGNEIFIGDTKTVLEKINQADEYYGWIKTTNDSLISDIKEQLAKYQNENSNETE